MGIQTHLRCHTGLLWTCSAVAVLAVGGACYASTQPRHRVLQRGEQLSLLKRKTASICSSRPKTISPGRELGLGAKASITERAESADIELPRTVDQMVAQAKDAIEAALALGKSRQRLDLILPINEKKYDFLAIEAMDYPCSLSEEFKAAVETTEKLLEALTGVDASTFTKQRLDPGGVEGDPCMLVQAQSENGRNFAAVAFPFSDNLKQLQRLAEEDTTLILVNPQWKDSGAVVSDFGFGPWKKAADDFLNTFEKSYTLTEQRIGAPSSLSFQDGKRYSDGGVVRVLRKFPSPHVAFVMAVDGASQAIGSFEESFPSYNELDAAIKAGREANLQIFDYAKDAVMPNPFAKQENADFDAAVESPAEVVERMDKTAIRQALTSRGLPTSGTMATIRDRLRIALEREA